MQDLRNLRLGLDFGWYLCQKSFTIWSIYVKLLVSPAPIDSSCVVPIKMQINCLCLISNLQSEIKPKTPSHAPLALSRGFWLTNKFVIIFAKIAENTQIISRMSQSVNWIEFY